VTWEVAVDFEELIGTIVTVGVILFGMFLVCVLGSAWFGGWFWLLMGLAVIAGSIHGICTGLEKRRQEGR
jgi:hypothetical protein